MDVNPYEASGVAGANLAVEEVRGARPIGVWIATIWAGLFAGVLPLFVEIFMLFFGPAELRELMGGTTLLVSAALAVGIIASAIGTFAGHSVSRYVLVWLVAIHYAFIAYNNLAMLSAGIEVRGGLPRLISRVVRSLVTAGIIGGYLTLNRRARSFFR